MAAAATTEVFEKEQEQSEVTETLDGNCRAKETGGHFPVSTPALGKVRFVLPTSVFCRGRDAGCPTPPSQIPAGGIPAPGSSSQLALAFAIGIVFGGRKSSNR